MIRQDEATRRGTAAIFLDTRVSALGTSGEPAFERAVSAAASMSALLARSGFSVRLTTAESKVITLGEDDILEELAGVRHGHLSSLAEALVSIRSMAATDTTLVAVTAPPAPKEISVLTRAGSPFGRKLGILVYPVEPSVLPSSAQAELEGRASVARVSLTRAGWDVIVLTPSTRLKDAWHASKATSLPLTAFSR